MQVVVQLIDCQKLSQDTSSHAAQNDRLPLRVVVQVLFFEQLRAAGAAAAAGTPSASVARCIARLAEQEEEEERWNDGRALPEPPTPGALKRQLGSLKLQGDHHQGAGDDGRRLVARSNSVANQSSRMSLSSRSRRIFDRLWVGGAKLPGEAAAAGNSFVGRRLCLCRRSESFASIRVWCPRPYPADLAAGER